MKPGPDRPDPVGPEIASGTEGRQSNSPLKSSRILSDTLPDPLSDAYPGARIEPLSGGRANRLWRVTPAEGDAFVVKRHEPSRATPLFPNDAAVEALALRALRGTGLAPDLLSEAPWLTYRFVSGATPFTDPGAAGRALARLHARPAPDGLRRMRGGHAEVLGMGERLAEGRSDLVALRPEGDVPPSTARAFLHGDPVPANIVGTSSGPVLIDWQCPGDGDPCEDISVCLSPAMRSLYGGEPLDSAQLETFLDAYGDPATAARYRALAPAFHWRMAAYCLWMAGRGQADYGRAAALELAMLQK